MNETVIISVASRLRLERARAWLGDRDPGEELIIVGANLGAANDLARGLAHAKGAAFGWHRFTLARLAAEIATPAMSERALAPITPLASAALLTRLVHQTKSAGAIGRYQGIADTPGFPRAITGVIAELRFAGVARDAVADAAPDLARLIAGYETELSEVAVTDWPAVFALAAEHARHHRLAGCPLLMLDVPIANEAELAFLEALAARAPAVLATVPTADEPTLHNLRDRLQWPIEDADSESPGIAAPVALIQRNLFREHDPSPATGSGEAVQVFSAPGEGRECVEITRRVLALAADGLRFDRIAVLLRAPEAYRVHLEETFARANIPAHFVRGARRPDAAGRAFVALLTCAAEDLSARRFAEYLSLGQVPDAAAGGIPPPATARGDRWVSPDSELTPDTVTEAGDEEETAGRAEATEHDAPVREGQLRAPWRWEKLLIEAAVIGGRERWQRRIDGLVHDLRVRMTELDDEGEAEAAILADQLDDLAAFGAYALPLIDALAAFPQAAIWADWLDQLGELATRALKRPDRVLAVVAELAPLAPVGPVTLVEVLRIVGPLLLEITVSPASQGYGKVFVGPIEAVRGLSFDAVFIPGLAERRFPHKIVEEPILLDSVRAQISHHLVTNPARLDAERLALALAVGAAENRICFSYPRLDLDTAQPRPRVPSFYALELLRASEGHLPDFAELAHRAETATTARLGWPAPPDPALAIDDAEYDLAILERLAATSVADAGAARYLVTANPHLYRALGARYQRWGFNWTPADGLLTRSEAARTVMAQHGFGVRSHSPTALQHYARCPYRFFLSAIQRLAPRVDPEPIDQLDPLQRGALIHAIQFELFARLRRDGLLPLRPVHLERVWGLLDGVTAEIAARYYDELAPAIDRVWIDGIAAIVADLREWLRQASEDDSGFVPRHFELSFGLRLGRSERAADPRSVSGAVDLACGIQLRGSIDLVEIHSACRMRVTDHKTGKIDGKPGQVIAGGVALQPLLYALAAEKLFTGEAVVESGRLYFCTATGGYAAIEVPLDDHARAAVTQMAETIGDSLAGPFLPAAPDKGVCAICDFRVVCGPHEERRAGQKPKASLAPLLALRAAP